MRLRLNAALRVRCGKVELVGTARWNIYTRRQVLSKGVGPHGLPCDPPDPLLDAPILALLTYCDRPCLP